MFSSLVVWFALVTQISCFYNLCHSRKNAFLSDDECSELFFEPSEKETTLGRVELRLDEDSLRVTPKGGAWNNAYLRVTMYNNQSRKRCNQLTHGGSSNFCIQFGPQVENDTFLLEYKAENLPETSSRKFLMTLPQPEALIFPYVDLTDTSRLILNAQKLPSGVNVTYYKVEAYKEKNNATRLLDLRLFNSNQEVFYELFTYNDEGDYYFVVTVMSGSCEEEVCSKQATPVVYIGRKSTRLVIGIVGASFILPFVLFLFHILTKKYPIEENRLEEGIMIAYKSSFKKHNDVVVALAALLEALSKNRLVEVVDLAKSSKKFPEKFCVDALIAASRVVYVTSPKSDPSHNVTVDKVTSRRQVLAVVFDHCTDRLPATLENVRVFRLFADLDGFLRALNIDASSYESSALYADLLRKTEEARAETERHSDALPKIVVTVEDPGESDALIGPPQLIL